MCNRFIRRIPWIVRSGFLKLVVGQTEELVIFKFKIRLNFSQIAPFSENVMYLKYVFM